MFEDTKDTILRAFLFHTPRNPFIDANALVWHSDGGMLIRDGRIAASGDYSAVRSTHPNAETVDLRGGFLIPGLIDTHTHFPQVRVLASLGYSLLDWLEQCALPEEARMADIVYARQIANEFIQGLVSHGTTTALVFGAHFTPATAALFEAAEERGLRITSGLVMSDLGLRQELLQRPEAAYRESTELIKRFHMHGRLRYAVTPRFALSSSDAMLEACQTLMREHTNLLFQTHLNENPREIELVAKQFPWASDYLAVYERFGLLGQRSVMAHSVHSSSQEITRLATTKTAVAHCASSNAALGSGIFPLRRHVEAGVRCALGTDIGAGTGFGLLKEALQAHLMQRASPEGMVLRPAHLLYLATRAGANALGLSDEIGDFEPRKSADLVYLRPPANSTLAAVIERSEDAEQILAALFTLAESDSVQEVRIEGSVVYRTR